MYRPLYMFGFPGNNKPTLNTTLSLAALPTYGTATPTATITMKPTTSGPTARRSRRPTWCSS